jgi:predicted MFS family arabinose efflux permease
MTAIKLLDRNNNVAILTAGIVSLILGIGIARFAFTSLLPPMLDDFLDVTATGILASVNFVGYLSGAIFAIFIQDINTKVRYFRLGMVLSVLTTAILGISEDQTLWMIARLIAGFGTAMGMVVGSAIVMTKLDMEDKTKAMGIHFSGIGIAILVTDLISKAVMSLGYGWSTAWLVLSLSGIVMAAYAIYILSFDQHIKQSATKHRFDIKIFSPFVIILTLAYFTEGVGFVVQATFLPNIIDTIPGLEGWGSRTWTMVGLAGIPSCILWMRLAHRFGSIKVIMLAMGLQVIGILLPTMTSSITLILLSGLLYGGTFVGLVALFLNLGGKIAAHNPVILMGAFTTAYGIGQVSAPLYSVALVNLSGNYDYALYVTAAIVTSGILLLLYGRRYRE